MKERNQETIRRWVEELWNGRDLGVCDELIAARFVEHATAPFSAQEPGEVDGPATMRASVAWLLGQFPDLTMTIQAIATDGDLVAVRVSSRGTNLGRLNGVLPASGKAFDAEQSHWFRLTDGKIAEHWATRDDLTTMLQLGVVRRPRLAVFLRQQGRALAFRFRRAQGTSR